MADSTGPMALALRSVIRHLHHTTQQFMEEVLHREKTAVVGKMVSSTLHDYKNPVAYVRFAADYLSRRHEAQRYRRHRVTLEEIRRVLRARSRAGILSASAQWDALRSAVRAGSIPLKTLPPRSTDERDFFVACECEVDAAGQFVRVVRVYRASEGSHRIVGGGDGFFLKTGEKGVGKAAVAVRQGGGTGADTGPTLFGCACLKKPAGIDEVVECIEARLEGK